MYHVFNMGIGFAVILDEKYAQQAVDILSKYHDASIIGRIKEDEDNRVLITTHDNKQIEL